MMKSFVIFLVVAILAFTSVNVNVAAECPKICTLIYSPVCGQDATGRTTTFGSMCQYEAHNCNNPTRGWRILKTGECPDL
ncbi:Kazal-type serine protease inhibitor domain [Popillia japonica]|uniref:Kazal-type serine protease inhibitor domain n=1 Tax=Popillia japonica TaxID=7064 RepID=A0AAW1J086_POPJA